MVGRGFLTRGVRGNRQARGGAGRVRVERTRAGDTNIVTCAFTWIPRLYAIFIHTCTYMIRQHHLLSGCESEQTGKQRRTVEPGVLRSMVSQRVGLSLVTEQQHIGVNISHVLPHLVSFEEGLEATPPLAMSTLSTRGRFFFFFFFQRKVLNTNSPVKGTRVPRRDG